MRAIWVSVVMVCVLVMTQSGCMTTFFMPERLDHRVKHVYQPTGGEIEFIVDSMGARGLGAGPLASVLATCDLPITVFADTLFLPLDLTVFRSRHKQAEADKN